MVISDVNQKEKLTYFLSWRMNIFLLDSVRARRLELVR